MGIGIIISKLFVRREPRLATGGNETSSHNVCLRTAVSQARGGEVRPKPVCSNSEERIGLQAYRPLLMQQSHWLPLWRATHGKAITDAPSTANTAKAARDLIILYC
jgi:hypothetical protein